MFNTKHSESEPTTALRIQTNKEYENLVPPMSKEAFESLMSSIGDRGQLEPITINNKGEVLDGHNRLKVCEMFHIEPLLEVKAFDSPSDEKLYIIDVNLQRQGIFGTVTSEVLLCCHLRLIQGLLLLIVITCYFVLT